MFIYDTGDGGISANIPPPPGRVVNYVIFFLTKSAGKRSKMAENKERESLSDILNDSEVNEDDEEVLTAAEVLERLEQVYSR